MRLYNINSWYVLIHQCWRLLNIPTHIYTDLFDMHFYIIRPTVVFFLFDYIFAYIYNHNNSFDSFECWVLRVLWWWFTTTFNEWIFYQYMQAKISWNHNGTIKISLIFEIQSQYLQFLIQNMQLEFLCTKTCWTVP